MQFKKIKYYFFLIFIALVLVSCAKDELEAPAETSEIRAIDEGAIQDAGNEKKMRTNNHVVRNTGDVEINDDGDEEDEGRNPDKAK